MDAASTLNYSDHVFLIIGRRFTQRIKSDFSSRTHSKLYRIHYKSSGDSPCCATALIFCTEQLSIFAIQTFIIFYYIF